MLSKKFPSLKVAIVHDWLITYAGAERVLAELIEVFPDAELFTIVDFMSDEDRRHLKNKRSSVTFIQKLPYASKRYRNYLPLMPLAIEQHDLAAFDLIISSSHAVAKGVITGPDQIHICMCYSPVRYAWDLQHQYLAEAGLNTGIKSLVVRWLLHRFRAWDYRSHQGVDHFIAISDYIGRRINKVYGRSSTVIYPPVDVEAFTMGDSRKDFYLAASRLVPYKKIKTIIHAFNSMPKRKLVVIGDGPDYNECKKIAGPNIKIMGWQSSDVLQDHMKVAKAFIFAAEEDFGIIPIEAQACGTPVIAYNKGAVRESLVWGLEEGNNTSEMFDHQTAESIADAVERFESKELSFGREVCRQNAMRFSKSAFREKLVTYIEARVVEWLDRSK